MRNIYSLTRSLGNVGMHVVSATDGREALRQLELHPEMRTGSYDARSSTY